ncbi:g-patch domain-containing protein [Hirsutella rhossiliensis]|uniref:G-patch domain-containing protein n=1 Tax=Hirsutella rhossiliensis TaxID=111463 RepID=A0A9P8MQL8_9HYPO|nr:g-patch domain-containing protein [Hirsutella rhossiliensis]KAH0959445.1 g-patch domain-containing protein [Hirsutella rhossiliensis]
MAAPPPPPPPARAAFSLYDNLHDPNDPTPPAIISAAPVRYQQPEPASSEPKKPIDPALLFQPQIRRPPLKQAKSKATFPKAIPKTASAAAPVGPKTTLADWTATEHDEWMYGAGERPQRGGRKKKRKKQQEESLDINWDEFYDAGRPTNAEQYVKSDEKINEVLDWKALLYMHRKRRATSDISSDEDDRGRLPQNRFAPPSAYAFAPPPPSPPNPPANDETGGDAFARRLAMSSTHPGPPAPSTAVTISREPVRYKQADEAGVEGEDRASYSPATPGAGTDDDGTAGPPRSKAPGQAGFAHRLMSKYGWTKGTGLGADESGIVNPLRVKVDKRRKKADADGGGWAEPGGRGKILGGKRKGDDQGKFGKMSQVIVVQNMLENMADLQEEISEGLGQEIGEECGEKYGRVERLYIDQESRQVFIRFTDQVSALRAVNELDGRVFNGNVIAPRFYDTDKFEQGIYTST